MNPNSKIYAPTFAGILAYFSILAYKCIILLGPIKERTITVVLVLHIDTKQQFGNDMVVHKSKVVWDVGFLGCHQGTVSP